MNSTSKHGVTVGPEVGSEVVGSEVVGEAVGSGVGSEVVGTALGPAVGSEVVGPEVGSEVVGSEVVGAPDGASEAHCCMDERQMPFNKNGAHAMLIGSWHGPEPVTQLRHMKISRAVGGDGVGVGATVSPGSVGALVVGGATGATVVGEAVGGGVVGGVGAGGPHFSILDRHSEASSVGPRITKSAQTMVYRSWQVPLEPWVQAWHS